jgi:hypothetical protein
MQVSFVHYGVGSFGRSRRAFVLFLIIVGRATRNAEEDGPCYFGGGLELGEAQKEKTLDL